VKKSCAVGQYSVGHEIGHNFGLDHDPANARSPPYPYGTGHLIDSESEWCNPASCGYRTIMAYNTSSGHPERRNYYSNPDVFLPDTNTPTGTEMSNNAKVLIQNRFKVAALGDESSSQCNPNKNNNNDYETEEVTTEIPSYEYETGEVITPAPFFDSSEEIITSSECDIITSSEYDIITSSEY